MFWTSFKNLSKIVVLTFVVGVSKRQRIGTMRTRFWQVSGVTFISYFCCLARSIVWLHHCLIIGLLRLLYFIVKDFPKRRTFTVIIVHWVLISILLPNSNVRARESLLSLVELQMADALSAVLRMGVIDNYVTFKTFQVKWAATWQNQQSDCASSEDSDQPGHPPTLIRVFAVRMKKPWALTYPLSAQRRLRSDVKTLISLIWVFPGRTLILLVLSCRGSNELHLILDKSIERSNRAS